MKVLRGIVYARPAVWQAIFRAAGKDLQEEIKWACGGREDCDQAVGGLKRDERDSVLAIYRRLFPGADVVDQAA